VLIEQAIGIDRSGEPIRKLEANPALAHLDKISERLGHSADATLLSRKSRGESAADLASAAADIARHEEVRAYLKDPAVLARFPLRQQGTLRRLRA
jgi:hypothetical protein